MRNDVGGDLGGLCVCACGWEDGAVGVICCVFDKSFHGIGFVSFCVALNLPSLIESSGRFEMYLGQL